MRKQAYPLTQLTGGLDVSKDPIYLPDPNSPNVLGLRFDKGVVKKDWGYSTLGLPLLGTPMHFANFTLTTGATYSIIFTTSSVYKWNATSIEWEDVTEGETLEDCEDVWQVESNVTCATGDGKVGTSCIVLTISETFSTGLAAHETISSANLTGYTYIHLLVNSSIDLASGDVQLLLDDTNTCESPIETINFPALSAGVWTRVSLAIATPASCSAIISVGIKVAVNQAAFTFSIDDVRAVKEMTGNEDNPIYHCILTDLLIFTNGKDAVKKFTGTAILNLGGSPPVASTLISFQNRVVLGGVNNYPFRIQWSSAGTSETWTGGTSGSIDLVDTPDWCINFILLGNKCFLLKEETLWDIRYVGSTSVFSPIKVADVGTEGGHTLSRSADKIFFHSSDSFYSFDQTTLSPFIENLNPLLFQPGERIVNTSKLNRAPSIYVKSLQQYWICYPTTGNVPDTLFKLSLKDGSCSRRNEMNITAFGEYQSGATGVTTWTMASGHWDDYLGVWRHSVINTGNPALVFAMSDGQVYEDTQSITSADTAVFETKDFLFGHASRITEVRVEARFGAFTLSHSVDGGLTWHGGRSFAAQDDWKEYILYLNLTTQTIRFKVETSASEFEMRWIEPWYIARTRSAVVASS